MSRSAVVVLLVLAGCGGGDSSGSKPPVPVQAPAAAPTAAPAPAPAPVFSARSFVGSWKATLGASRLRQGSRSLEVPVEEAKTFTFSVSEKADVYFLDGPTPMALKSQDRSLTGESRGVSVRLTFVPPGIAGEITRKSSDSDSTMVLEFEAQRSP